MCLLCYLNFFIVTFLFHRFPTLSVFLILKMPQYWVSEGEFYTGSFELYSAPSVSWLRLQDAQ